MTRLTLLEAFRLLTPSDGIPDDQLERATAIVQAEVQRLARRLTFSEQVCEDAAVETTLHMLYGGSRTTGAIACDSDPRVRGFLKRAVYNKAVELWRQEKARAEEPLDLPDRPRPLAVVEQTIEDELSSDDLPALAARIDDAFHATVVPACADGHAHAAARTDFLQSVAHMRALVYEETTIDAVVVEATGRSGPTAEAAVHARHSRARRRLLEYLREEEAAGRMTPVLAQQYRGCVSFLQRRASSAKESARRALRDQP